MAIATVLIFRGGTLERYDELLAKLGFTTGGPGPAGSLFSWVTATDEGLMVTGVWESRRDFEQFAAEFGAVRRRGRRARPAADHVSRRPQLPSRRADPGLTRGDPADYASSGASASAATCA